MKPAMPPESPTTAQCLSDLFRVALLVVMLGLTACASGPGKDESSIGSTQDAGRAINTLLARAELQVQQSRWERAAALLERALRIEPRNAGLWHRLALVRFRQGRYAMAESLAQKSTALAGDDEALKRRNAELIEMARRAAAGD
ncbi:MAG TPA: tetratricopeptide repeat protein [Gammaproteobacteria bacterium]|nr:tetratricopeptide repeat protein [Gammaproteobacteria bacterium]